MSSSRSSTPALSDMAETSSSHPHSAALTTPPTSPSNSDTSALPNNPEIDHAFDSLTTCAALGESVSKLLCDAQDVQCTAPWDGESAESMPSALESVVTMNVRALELLDKAVGIQTSICERMYGVEGDIGNLRAEVGQSQRASKRMLYRAKVLARPSLGDPIQHPSTKQDTIAEDVFQLALAIARLRQHQANHNTALDEATASLKLVVDELTRLKQSAWSYRARVFACELVRLVAAALCFLAMLFVQACGIAYNELWACVQLVYDRPDILGVVILSVTLSEEKQAMVVDRRPIWEAACE